MPATAICWSTYEFFKFFLSRESKDLYRSSVMGSANMISNKTTGKSLTTTDDHVTKSTNKRYVIPKPPVINADIKPDNTLHRSTSEPPITGTQYLPTSRELPSISGVGVYTAINMNPMHTDRVFDPSMRGCSR